jgi:hypothetical protein
METVKVDLRKLQTLNDRINQTIDALTQLRQSVHGFQPAAFGQGLSHTGAYGSPYTSGAYGMGAGIQAGIPGAVAAGFSPWASASGVPFASPSAIAGQNAWWGPAGLSHSSYGGGYGGIELNPWNRYVDQASAFRIAQSFPNAFAQMSPVVAL